MGRFNYSFNHDPKRLEDYSIPEALGQVVIYFEGLDEILATRCPMVASTICCM
jgi:hypothetical protein